MREIKFRAWLKDEKEMIDVKAIDFDENGDVFSVNYPEGKSYSGYDKDEIELMQYVGLKDKNGVEIFEGDIVKLWKAKSDDYDSWFEPTRELKVINFKNGCFRFGCREFIRYNTCSYELEVIGNIYENKELLEGREN